MENLNTVDSILEALKKMSETKEIIDVDVYLRGAEKLNSLLQEEQNILFSLEQDVAKMRRKLLVENKETASATKMIIEASDEYTNARKQKAKIDRVLETIRIAKLHARLSNDVYKAN